MRPQKVGHQHEPNVQPAMFSTDADATISYHGKALRSNPRSLHRNITSCGQDTSAAWWKNALFLVEKELIFATCLRSRLSEMYLWVNASPRINSHCPVRSALRGYYPGKAERSKFRCTCQARSNADLLMNSSISMLPLLSCVRKREARDAGTNAPIVVLLTGSVVRRHGTQCPTRCALPDRIWWGYMHAWYRPLGKRRSDHCGARGLHLVKLREGLFCCLPVIWLLSVSRQTHDLTLRQCITRNGVSQKARLNGHKT